MKEDYVLEEVVSKGRAFENVIEKLWQVWKDAEDFVESGDKDAPETFGELLEYIGYRMYLLGVEDGMKGDAE